MKPRMNPLATQPGRVRGIWPQTVEVYQEFVSPRSIMMYCSAEPAEARFLICSGMPN